MTGVATAEAGDTQCLLHIPHQGTLTRLEHVLAGVDMTDDQRRRLRAITIKAQHNNYAIERWVRHFYFNCICDCDGGSEG